MVEEFNCPDCGTKFTRNTPFCPECGLEFEWNNLIREVQEVPQVPKASVDVLAIVDPTSAPIQKVQNGKEIKEILKSSVIQKSPENKQENKPITPSPQKVQQQEPQIKAIIPPNQKKLLECPRCEIELSSQLTQCPNCNARLDWKTATVKYYLQCPLCQQLSNRKGVQCENCGVAFK